MIQLTYEAAFIMLTVFGFALHRVWVVAEDKGHEQGYGDACYDVAHGNIKVTLEEIE